MVEMEERFVEPRIVRSTGKNNLGWVQRTLGELKPSLGDLSWYKADIARADQYSGDSSSHAHRVCLLRADGGLLCCLLYDRRGRNQTLFSSAQST